MSRGKVASRHRYRRANAPLDAAVAFDRHAYHGAVDVTNSRGGALGEVCLRPAVLLGLVLEVKRGRGAHAVASAGVIDYADVAAWCDARMPAFMVPRYFDTLAELPRTPTEKVRKKELRERGVGPGTWDRARAGSATS